ncbi:FRG domain-containing protein [Geothrix sp. 21YS21S-4]|uniref:FRG domain-containing protein n=1 Tax=Geothrix sp. 21YS21S-4 TaxID=3068889 RepID=UPI0035942CEC
MLCEYDCQSWRMLQDEVRGLQQEIFSPGPVERLSRSSFLYRGQGDARWGLETTLERHGPSIRTIGDYYRLGEIVKPLIESFTDRRWDAINCIEINKLFSDYQRPHFTPLPNYDYLVHLRHHGFPSPLLDWTRSLHIAAYFACRAPHGDRIAIYAYQEFAGIGKVGSSNAPQIRSQGPYVRTHPRHFLQQAEYTICWQFIDSKWQFVRHESVFDQNLASQDRLWRFTLPASECDRVLQELDLVNINAFSLFQTEDALMEALRRRLLPGPEEAG